MDSSIKDQARIILIVTTGDPQLPAYTGEIRRTFDPGHSSRGPSWIDLAENRVNKTESGFAAGLNRLL